MSICRICGHFLDIDEEHEGICENCGYGKEVTSDETLEKAIDCVDTAMKHFRMVCGYAPQYIGENEQLPENVGEYIYDNCDKFGGIMHSALEDDVRSIIAQAVMTALDARWDYDIQRFREAEE